jgi:hypothetical protein
VVSSPKRRTVNITLHRVSANQVTHPNHALLRLFSIRKVRHSSFWNSSASDHRSAYTAHAPDAAAPSYRNRYRRHGHVPIASALCARVYFDPEQWKSLQFLS